MVSDSVWESREKQQQQQILQMAIVEHLYQQGMLSVAEELSQVPGLPVTTLVLACHTAALCEGGLWPPWGRGHQQCCGPALW